MKRLIAAIVVCALAGGARAGGWAGTYSLAAGSVSFTNSQANSSWMPVAILWKFEERTDVTMSVERISQGNTFVLGMMATTNVTSAIWVPEADYPFLPGDVLRVTSTASGVLHVIRTEE